MNPVFTPIVNIAAGDHPDIESDVLYRFELPEGEEACYQNAELREEIACRYFYEGRPGQLFCHNMTIYQDTVVRNRGILKLEHRLDI